jgi:hypothetical protein
MNLISGACPELRMLYGELYWVDKNALRVLMQRRWSKLYYAKKSAELRAIKFVEQKRVRAHA